MIFKALYGRRDEEEEGWRELEGWRGRRMKRVRVILCVI